MARQIQVTVPLDKKDHVMAFLTDREHVFALNDFPGTTSAMVMFKMAPKRCGTVLQALSKDLGVGRYYGTIDIVTLQSTIPRLSHYYENRSQGQKKKRKYILSDRMTVEEIYEIIDGQSHLTFDYLAMICVAALIAAVGLITDSSVTVVASMLVSPLMGPILGVTFGASIENWEMVKKSVYNEVIGVCLCLGVGMLVGLCVCPFYGPGGITHDWAQFSLTDSQQISDRGDFWSLLGGAFVAIPSGMGVALGITSGGVNALVGVAISAALLPPIVNCGMCLTFGIYFTAFGFDETGIKWLSMSAASMSLFLMNFVCIFVFAMLMFKVKKINRAEMLAGSLDVRPSLEEEPVLLQHDTDRDGGDVTPAPAARASVTRSAFSRLSTRHSEPEIEFHSLPAGQAGGQLALFKPSSSPPQALELGD